MVAFLPIANNLPFLENKNYLSIEQKYLMNICVAVSSVNCSLDLYLRHLGKFAHSRYLTLANHVLRLYVATGSLRKSQDST